MDLFRKRKIQDIFKDQFLKDLQLKKIKGYTSPVSSDKSSYEVSDTNSTFDIDMSEASDVSSDVASNEASPNRMEIDPKFIANVIDKYNINSLDIEMTSEENDQVLDYLIDKNGYMDFDWSLPHLHNKFINIEDDTYKIKVGIDVDDVDVFDDVDVNKVDDKTIIIPNIGNRITKDRSLSEVFFDKFLNKTISDFNTVSLNSKIEPFNKEEDVIYVNPDGSTHFGSLTDTLSKRSSVLIFIPVKIQYDNYTCHLNVIVVNNIKRTFTYYEPYGDYYEVNNRSIVNSGLEKIKTILLSQYPFYTYIDAHVIYKDKRLGVQKRSESFYHISEGYCVAWCLYLCYICTLNLHLSTKYSISVILNKVFEEYTDLQLLALIRTFIEFVKTA